MLGAIEQEQLEEAAANDAFLDYLRRVSAKLVTWPARATGSAGFAATTLVRAWLRSSRLSSG
jgi:hypothetical protein